MAFGFSKNRRKQLVITPEIQYTLLKYLAALIATIFIAQILSVILFFRQLAMLDLDSGRGTSAVDFLSEYKFLLLTYQLIPILGVSSIGFYFFNRFTNRLAGPIFNILRTLKKVNAGESTAPIKLREGDYFGELADEINVLIERKKSP